MKTPAKISPGEKFHIPADFYNTLIDMTQQIIASQGRGGGSPMIRGPQPFTLMRVKNMSGSDRGMLDPVASTGLVISALDDALDWPKQVNCVQVTTASATLINNAQTTFILAEPIPSLGYGWAYATGMFPARVDTSGTGGGGGHARPYSATSLISGGGQYRIIATSGSAAADRICLVMYPAYLPAGNSNVAATTITSGIGGADALQTDSWTLAGDATPPVIDVITRIATNTGVTKAYSRRFGIDGHGRITTISAEKSSIVVD